MNNLRTHNATVREEIDRAIQSVLDSGQYLCGRETEQFEQEYAAFCAMEHCIAVANGTDALELLIRGFGLGPGDQVVTVANAGMYSTRAITAAGAIPVFADIGEDDLNLDPGRIERALTRDTKAIMATHLYGRMADMQSISAIARRHNLICLEDCAQAHGARLHGTPAGAWGDGAAFSFYPSKNLGALGDAGAVVVADAEVAGCVRRLRQYGWSRKYHAKEPGGRNSRMDEIQAAILRVKLPHLQHWNARRKAVAETYEKYLLHPSIRTPRVDGDDYVAHLYVVRTSERPSLLNYLKRRGIAHDIHYPVLDYHQYQSTDEFDDEHLPVTEKYVGQVLSLPCYPEMDLADVHRIAEIVNQWKP